MQHAIMKSLQEGKLPTELKEDIEQEYGGLYKAYSTAKTATDIITRIPGISLIGNTQNFTSYITTYNVTQDQTILYKSSLDCDSWIDFAQWAWDNGMSIIGSNIFASFTKLTKQVTRILLPSDEVNDLRGIQKSEIIGCPDEYIRFAVLYNLSYRPYIIQKPSLVTDNGTFSRCIMRHTETKDVQSCLIDLTNRVQDTKKTLDDNFEYTDKEKKAIESVRIFSVNTKDNTTSELKIEIKGRGTGRLNTRSDPVIEITCVPGFAKRTIDVLVLPAGTCVSTEYHFNVNTSKMLSSLVSLPANLTGGPELLQLSRELFKFNIDNVYECLLKSIVGDVFDKPIINNDELNTVNVILRTLVVSLPLIRKNFQLLRGFRDIIHSTAPIIPRLESRGLLLVENMYTRLMRMVHPADVYQMTLEVVSKYGALGRVGTMIFDLIRGLSNIGNFSDQVKSEFESIFRFSFLTLDVRSLLGGLLNRSNEELKNTIITIQKHIDDSVGKAKILKEPENWKISTADEWLKYDVISQVISEYIQLNDVDDIGRYVQNLGDEMYKRQQRLLEVQFVLRGTGNEYISKMATLSQKQEYKNPLHVSHDKAKEQMALYSDLLASSNVRQDKVESVLFELGEDMNRMFKDAGLLFLELQASRDDASNRRKLLDFTEKWNIDKIDNYIVSNSGDIMGIQLDEKRTRAKDAILNHLKEGSLAVDQKDSYLKEEERLEDKYNNHVQNMIRNYTTNPIKMTHKKPKREIKKIRQESTLVSTYDNEEFTGKKRKQLNLNKQQPLIKKPAIENIIVIDKKRLEQPDNMNPLDNALN
jgi:hypothetical protein